MIYVVGHKNPDADTICSAIAYAEFKKKMGFKQVIAARAGELNEQTKWILDYANENAPIYLPDIYLKAKDIMKRNIIFINKEDSLNKAIKLMKNNDIRHLPVLNKNKEIEGMLSFLDLADFFFGIAINNKAISSFFNKKVLNFYDKEVNTCYEDELQKEVERKVIKSRYKCAIVLNSKNKVVGVVTRTDLLELMKPKLILVDHNELAQAIDGAETAEILEVIDHHRIATFTTLQPIHFFINPIGSTSTIIYELYNKNCIKIEKKIAFLLLCGIISDTLNLISSTTTTKDKEAVKELSKIVNVKPEFIWENFVRIAKTQRKKILDKPAETIIKNDFKVYKEKKTTIGLGQIEIDDFNDFYKKKDEIVKEIQIIKNKEKFDFVGLIVTNVNLKTSFLVCEGNEDFIEKLPWPKVQERIYELKGLFSRKKQIAPVLLKIAEKKEGIEIRSEEDYYRHYHKK